MLLSWRDNTSYPLSSHQDEEPGSEMSYTKKPNCWPTGPLFPNFKMGRMRKKGVRGWERERDIDLTTFPVLKFQGLINKSQWNSLNNKCLLLIMWELPILILC